MVRKQGKTVDCGPNVMGPKQKLTAFLSFATNVVDVQVYFANDNFPSFLHSVVLSLTELSSVKVFMFY